MTTAILTLRGLLQSWGDTLSSEVRRTGHRPTKSAVVGMAAGAMGLRAGSSVSHLLNLEFGVRSDFVGLVVEDYHIGRTWNLKKPYREDTGTTVSRRHYLEDSAFVVALSGDPVLITEVAEALRNPVLYPYLGRQGAMPSMPVFPVNRGVFDGSLMEALTAEPWQAPMHIQLRHFDPTVQLQVVRDAGAGETPHDVVMDIPATGLLNEREFTPRPVVFSQIEVPVPPNEEINTRQQKLFGAALPTRRSLDIRTVRNGLLTEPGTGRVIPPSVAPTGHDPFSVL